MSPRLPLQNQQGCSKSFNDGHASSTGAVGVNLLREGAVVWSDVIEIKDALSSKVTVKSGLDWDTARGDRWSE